ncbi:hypothetical protein C8R47DRAFT_428689 [Mycena vitilis]|nr:hypothetical protein C8R47DRAFT_428689 [Mycena vitilis]
MVCARRVGRMTEEERVRKQGSARPPSEFPSRSLISLGTVTKRFRFCSRSSALEGSSSLLSPLLLIPFVTAFIKNEMCRHLHLQYNDHHGVPTSDPPERPENNTFMVGLDKDAQCSHRRRCVRAWRCGGARKSGIPSPSSRDTTTRLLRDLFTTMELACAMEKMVLETSIHSIYHI